jgi:hypothetical protein
MEELIARLTQAAGLDAPTARNAVGIILNFLRKEAPAEHVDQAVAALPGAAETADIGGGELASGSGGLMALAGQLSSAGLSMSQMQVVGRELFAYVREKAGEDVVGGLVAAVPGLSQFV